MKKKIIGKILLITLTALIAFATSPATNAYAWLLVQAEGVLFGDNKNLRVITGKLNLSEDSYISQIDIYNMWRYDEGISINNLKITSKNKNLKITKNIAKCTKPGKYTVTISGKYKGQSISKNVKMIFAKPKLQKKVFDIYVDDNLYDVNYYEDEYIKNSILKKGLIGDLKYQLLEGENVVDIQKGQITGISPGTAKIKVTDNLGNFPQIITINVKGINLNEYSDEEDYSIDIGSYYQEYCKRMNWNYSDSDILKFTVDDPSVVSVCSYDDLDDYLYGSATVSDSEYNFKLGDDPHLVPNRYNANTTVHLECNGHLLDIPVFG